MAALDPSAKLLVRLKVDNPQSVKFQVHQYVCGVIHTCIVIRSAVNNLLLSSAHYTLYSLTVSLECL